RPPVQARHPAEPRAGRGDPGPDRGRDRPGAARRGGGGGMSAALIDIGSADPPGAPRARMMLARARWAAAAFATYDTDRTRRVVEAVAEVAYQNAERFATN